ncbi:hypothetical protein Tco_0818216 [Tanacetum coccineum]
MIRDNQFDGRIHSDSHRHVANFIEISNLFQYGEHQKEMVMLKMRELNEGTITLCNEMREAFISRHFSPPKFKRLLNEIHSFYQLSNETLIDAWLRIKEMIRTCYGHGLTKGTVIQILYHGLDDPTQGILDARGIFLYNTLNEVFKILEDKVLLKLDFSDDPHMSLEPKTVVSAGGSNIHSYHTILSEIFKALVTKFDIEFLNISKELKVTRDDHRGYGASQIYMSEDTPMCEPHEENYIQGYLGEYHDQNSRNPYSYPDHRHYPQS